MKNLKFIAFCIFVALFMTTGVNAQEVGTIEELLECVAEDGTCTLTTNIELENSVEIANDIVLDLNGQIISFDEDSVESGEDSVFTVLRGGKLTINDTEGTGKILAGDSGKIYAAVKMTKKGETETGDLAELVVNGGTLEGYYYAVVGNGGRHNTKITINNGVLKSTSTTGLAIYHPQEGTLDVKGGTLTGATGIEMRGGNLNITGGTIIGTYKSTEFKPNGSGSTSLGAGVAIAKHSTDKNININISGGIVKGYSAVYENESANKVAINITGGTFEVINDGVNIVDCENIDSFITGGNYSVEPDSKYIEKPYVAKKDGDVYVIGLDEEEIVADSTEVDTEEEVTEVQVGVAEADKEEVNDVLLDTLGKDGLVAGETGEIEVKLEITTENVSEDAKEDIEEAMEEEKLTIVEFFDANVNVYVDGDVVGNLEELTSEIQLTVMLPADLQECEEGYERVFYIIRKHGNEVEKLEAKLSEDGKYLTVGTDKFSTYAIAYEDVEEEVLPPQTGDNVITYILIGFISLIAFAGTGLFLKRKFN